AGVTGSLEPTFRLVADPDFKKRLVAACERYGYSGTIESVINHVRQTGSVQETDLPPQVKAIFACALELTPQAHLDMTATFQRQVDEGISKTINLPNSATVDDIERVFNACFKSGLKGMTVYRDGSRTLQPKLLNTKKDSTMPTVETLYGPMQLTPKIAKLIESPLVQRLDGIRQNGVAYLIDPRQSTTRFEHSLGVMSLAKLLGANESEQIAALLHDISHTAFSHLVDLVFGHKMQDYHDVMRDSFLQSELAQGVIKELGITEQELLCRNIPLVKGKGVNVDRLDYCIRDLLVTSRIFQPEYAAIVHNLVVDDRGEIRCKDLDTARLLFRKFIEVNREVYFDARVEAASLAVTTILKRMLQEGSITENDFFITDDHLLQKVAASPYGPILSQIGPNMEFRRSLTPTRLAPVLRKLRYIDPLIVGREGGLTEHCIDSRKLLEDYHKTETTHYYHIPLVEHLC
ncbi:MAG: HD domain-containing protein, partial [Verrucomicrobia bacterium]|nr:HD domain-containing protein [Verrucomicrobiota bacterium]